MIKLITINDNESIMFASVKDFDLKKDMNVIVESEKGVFLARTISDIKEYDEKDVSKEVASIIRIATDEDKKTVEKNDKEAEEALKTAKKYVEKYKLDMNIVSARYSFDKKQLLYIFTADGRIDFRELAKKLAQVYKTRIELRQVGVRDKAKQVGGLGPCGRPLCCSLFLSDFTSVSINMAKNQYIALNPTKINGVCGRLLCCLNYEDSQYSEMKKGLPKIGERVNIDGVEGKINSINLFLNTAVIETKNKVFVEVNLGDKYASNE